MKRIPCQIEKQVQMCHTEKQNFDLIRMHLFILTKVDSVANCSLHSHRANIRRLSVLQSSALWLQAPAAKKHLFILNFFFQLVELNWLVRTNLQPQTLSQSPRSLWRFSAQTKSIHSSTCFSWLANSTADILIIGFIHGAAGGISSDGQHYTRLVNI